MAPRYKQPCPDCGSSDALTDYGPRTKCYSCGLLKFKDSLISNDVVFEKPTKNASPDPHANRVITELPEEFHMLKDRGISMEAARKYGIRYSETGKWVHAYPFYKKGKHVATQYRAQGKKDFWFEGSPTGAQLFGQQAFPAGCAKYVTIVEGACDAAAAYEMLGHPVVAVFSAESARKEVVANYEYLNSFEKVIVCLDRDEAKVDPSTGATRYPGQDAALEIAKVLPLGKVRILTLTEEKDPNDYLRAGLTKRFSKEWWDAPIYTPAGLKKGSELLEDVLNRPKNNSLPYPFYLLNSMTYGIRKSEFVVLNAPTGVGKTTILGEMIYNILQEDKEAKVGLMKFEETNRDSAVNLMSIHASKPLHLPDVWENQTPEDITTWFQEIMTDRVILYDHFGSNSIHEVINKIKHMAAMGCTHIFIDHLSIIVSNQDGDERKELDEISTRIKTLCMELNLAVIAVIHQNRQGQIRGTAGVEQLANMVFKLERAKESPDDWRRNITKITIQKNRFCGITGPSSYLYYNPGTGRLTELTKEEMTKYDNMETVEVW